MLWELLGLLHKRTFHLHRGIQTIIYQGATDQLPNSLKIESFFTGNLPLKAPVSLTQVFHIHIGNSSVQVQLIPKDQYFGVWRDMLDFVDPVIGELLEAFPVA